MMSFVNYLKTTYKYNRGFSGLSLLNHRKIYREWTVQCKSKRTPLDLELPWITIIAKDYIVNFLKDRSKSEVNIFEFGSGGSSLFFLKYASQVVSVEHNKNWYELVSKTVKQKDLEGWNGHLIEPEPIDNHIYRKLDVSNPLHYHSTDETLPDRTFKNYATYIEKFPNNYFDVVLVDGRSRPSCLYHSLHKVKRGGLLVLDNAERAYYLSKVDIDEDRYKLILSSNSAIICLNYFSQTNIYIKK